MKKIVDEKNKKIFSMARNGYSVLFTLLDMGEYVGHKSRQWYEKASPFWETMMIDVLSEDPNKKLSSEFLIDSNGDFQRLIITDMKGYKRVILPLRPHYGIKEEDYEFYYGKGIRRDNNSFVRDIFVDENFDNIFESNNYYFDNSSKKFIDDNGNEAPKSILTNIDIGNVFRDAARSISNQFNLKNYPEELADIEFGDF